MANIDSHQLLSDKQQQKILSLTNTSVLNVDGLSGDLLIDFLCILFPYSIFFSCNTTPPFLINISLVSFIQLPAKMFHLYIGKFSFDLPMEDSGKSWLLNNGLTAKYELLENSSCPTNLSPPLLNECCKVLT